MSGFFVENMFPNALSKHLVFKNFPDPPCPAPLGTTGQGPAARLGSFAASFGSCAACSLRLRCSRWAVARLVTFLGELFVAHLGFSNGRDWQNTYCIFREALTEHLSWGLPRIFCVTENNKQKWNQYNQNKSNCVYSMSNIKIDAVTGLIVWK